MEIYANPPLLTVSFKRNGRQSIPNSPLGSPPNTPKRNSPVAEVLNTSTTTLNTYNSSAGAVVYKKGNIEMPMDEKKCYEGGKMSTIKTNAGEEVPDDEVPSSAKNSYQNLNQIARSKSESMVANFMTPERDLLSPPKVVKKMTTVLHVESDNFYENEGLIPLSPSPRNINNDKNDNFYENEGLIPLSPSPRDINNDKKSTLNTSISSSSSENIENKTHAEFDKIADLDNQETGGAFPDDEGYIPPTTPSGEIMSSSKSLDSDVPDDERNGLLKVTSFPVHEYQTKNEINPSGTVNEEGWPCGAGEAVSEFAGHLTVALKTLQSSDDGKSDDEEIVAALTDEDIPMTTPKDEVDEKKESGGYNKDSIARRPAPRRLKYDTDDPSDCQSAGVGRKDAVDSNAQEEMQRLASSAHLALKNGLDSSLQMLEQILEIQRKEYGSQDRRCDITIEKINMVRRRGSEFAATIEELQKTLALPETNKEAST